MEVILNKDPFTKRDWKIFGISSLITLIWIFLVRNHPFFWDNILNSRIAHYYYDTGFASLTIPESLDAGHPPFFSMYLAAGWKLLGKSLWASHLLMVPILLGTIYQYMRFAKTHIPFTLLPAAMLLFFLEPTYLAQSTMMSADLLLVFGFFLSLNSLAMPASDRNPLLLAIGLILMASVNVRGIFACGLIFAIDTWLTWTRVKTIRVGSVLPYIPAALFTAVWLWIHYRAVGWLLSPPPETYGAHREVVGASGMARNFAVAGWRVLDFGRIVLWTFLIIKLFIQLRKRRNRGREMNELILIFLIPLIGFTLLFIPFSNPIGHRYYMVSYLTGNILLLSLYKHYFGRSMRGMVMMGTISLALISGHFWVYPDGIAKGWDSSLAHVNWFPLRAQMNDYIAAEKIPPNEVLTEFPNILGETYTDLHESGFDYASREDISFEKAPYIIQSNVCNGFSDEELVVLKENWKEIRRFKQGQVYICLYQNPGTAFSR